MNRHIQLRTSLFLTLLWVSYLMVMAGCSTTITTYPYLAITNNCNCEEYSTVDKEYNIEYRFRAHYRMDKGVFTGIKVEITNHSKDTLFLDGGAVKISSRNVSYQYNDKFLPLPALTILPRRSDVLEMAGKDPSETNDWHKIAGEQLTLTLKRLRLGEHEIKAQTVTFVPKNPKLEKDEFNEDR
ncbi:MAG: hypothetical protein HY707_11910 [Ignavibacteriae bacterium]|nr:hypothetical protein [Ignavibacteriota bacterium]